MGNIYNYSLTSGGRQRTYSVYAPDNIAHNAPVVIVLHGGGVGLLSSIRQQAQMEPVADTNKFYVVYPQGTGVVNGVWTWNAGKCCGWAVNNHIDDVLFFKDLIKHLNGKHSINRCKVYGTGISNGAMMCYRLALETNIFAAIAPIAGGMGMPLDSPFPKQKTPICHFHGGADPKYPYTGGPPENPIGDAVDFTSIPDTIEYWVNANNSNTSATTQNITDAVVTTYSARSSATSTLSKLKWSIFSIAPNSVVTKLYYLPNGGHTWPGGVDITSALGTGNLISTVKASEIMWSFFKNYSSC